MKIEITHPSFTGYNGYLGPVEFKDGISVFDLSPVHVQMVMSNISCVDIATGLDPVLFYSESVPAVEEAPAEVPLTVPGVVSEHTRASLEAVADAVGIRGIRAISAPMGIKGNAISDLINKILVLQGQVETAAASAVVLDVAPDVMPADPAVNAVPAAE
jgi:hypothetical protein